MTIHEWKQLPLLHLHLFIPFKILLRDTNLFTEHFLGLSTYIDLRDIAGDIECVRFEGHLLDIWIEAAGTAHTDFIASHDVRHEHLVVDGLTLFTLPYQKNTGIIFILPRSLYRPLGRSAKCHENECTIA